MNKYKNIKTILQNQVDKKVQSMWTFDDVKNEFTQIYKNYNSRLTIYTPEQLLEKLKQINEIQVLKM